MKQSIILWILGFACFVGVVPGCTAQRAMITTPNLYLDGRGKATMDSVPEELRSSDIEVLYVTDRAPESSNDVGPTYGHRRSRKTFYGTATVSFDPKVSWEQLVTDSGKRDRDHRYHLGISSIREAGQFLPIESRYSVDKGGLVMTSEAKEAVIEEQKKFLRLVEARLEKAPTKDVYFLIHGVDNTFNDAVFRMAEIEHFVGRKGVPIAYTWPAGYGGMFGYFYDRESSEYTVGHLKIILMALASSEHVERIHIISHSRGTDVATTALRELNIASRARGEDPTKAWKIATLVLASPDLDADVFSQRGFAEGMFTLPGRIVIYGSKTDKLLGLSNWLFSGRKRLGSFALDDFHPEAREKFEKVTRIEFITCDVTGFSTSHDYEFAHPAVLSDLILVLRDGKSPGAENGRPLKRDGIVWKLTNDYAMPSAKPATAEAR